MSVLQEQGSWKANKDVLNCSTAVDGSFIVRLRLAAKVCWGLRWGFCQWTIGFVPCAFRSGNRL